MVGSSKTLMTICAMCGERRKKCPSSWTLHGSSVYCPGCWSKVECARCGHRDPKGDIYNGRWTCQSCRHHFRVKCKGSMYEDCHRLIIEDCNGVEVPPEVVSQDIEEESTHQSLE